jgi:hypothetical protein
VPAELNVDADALAKAREVFGAANVPPDKAQELLNLHASLAQKQAKAVADLFARDQRDQLAAAKADPELGGMRWEETLSVAARGMDRLNPRVRQVLEDAGVGNHPEIVRAFAAAGRLYTEDKLVTAGNGAAPRGPLALYPNTPGMNP